jgi:hypothetical protein
VLPAKEVDAVQSAARGAGVETWVLGEVRAGTKGVRFSP